MINSNIKYFGLLLIIFTLAACNNQRPGSTSDSTTPVWLSDISRRTIREISTTTGTAKATQTAEVTSEQSGKYSLQHNPKTGRPYQLGDIVEAGTIIIKLNNITVLNNASLETKRMDVDIAEKELAAQRQVNEMGGSTDKEVLTAEKSLISSRISLENAEMDVDKLSVKAPFKGVITKLPYYSPDVEVGSGQVMFEIMDYSRMYMEIELPENTIEKINVGQTVLITNYNIKSDTLKGELTQLSPAINETTRTFSGFISINNPDLKLRPGMFVKGEIITLQKDSVLAIPKEIIKNQRNQRIVYIVERNMAVEKNLKLGISDDYYVEVESGLTDEDKIVTKGYAYLRGRSQVKIMK